jgi:hypothetical protein
MITNANTARRFAQSIATQGVSLQNAIDAADFETAADLCEDIAADLEKVQDYINARLLEKDAN